VVVEKILEDAGRRADRAEVYFSEGETTTVLFKAGELHEAGIANSRGVAVRAFVDGRVGYGGTTDLTQPTAVVDAAVATAKHGRRAEYELPDGRADYADVTPFDADVAALKPEFMVELGEQADAMVKAADERYVVTVEIERFIGRTRLVNSAGLDRTEESTAYSFAVVVNRTTEGDIFYHYDYDMSFARDFDEIGVVERLLDSLQWVDRTVELETGKMDLVVDPAQVPSLLLPVVTCINGAYVADRSSALAGRLGEQVASPAFSLVDNATNMFGWMSGSFDGEGTPTRRTPVIERGVLKSFLTDLATAERLNTAPTGHARRGVGSPPRPGTSNVIVEAGETPAAELIADTARGVLVRGTAGSSMGNIRGGELSATITYGLKIENGEIVGRVKDCLFAGNVFEMLGERLRAVASDPRRSGGSYLTPAIFVSDQTVTAKG
jgi:PmbA protein